MDDLRNSLHIVEAHVLFCLDLRAFTDESRCVTAMSITQGSDVILPLLDKVLVINSSRQIFYGPFSEAKAYFEGLGFTCSPTTTTTDFLNSISADPEVHTVQDLQNGPVPETPTDFESAFRSSPHWTAVHETIHRSNPWKSRSLTARPSIP